MLTTNLCTQPLTNSESFDPTLRKRDPLWNAVQAEALEATERDPIMSPMLNRLILNHQSLGCALVFRLAEVLSEAGDGPGLLQRVFSEVLAANSELRQTITDDLRFIRLRDPAATSNLTPFLNFKGFHALQATRIAHTLWQSNREQLALYLQGRISTVYGVDIHPAADLGRGIFIDHATGVVVGETATIGNNVVILHDVTLGATGKDIGDRHPKVDDEVFIGAGTKILGNIRVGHGATVGSGSIVLHDVPAGATVAGIPARVVSQPAERGNAAKLIPRANPS